MSDHTDRELVELAQRGDRTAIGELFSRYWRAARAAAFGVTGEFTSAEDAAAEGFVQALAGLQSLRDPGRFGAWLRTIVVRKARLDVRGRYAALDAEAEDRRDQHERPDDIVERRELGAVVQQALRDLPEPLREAVALFYFEGYDSNAAARFLDIPPGTLRRRLHDGRTQLGGAVERILRGSTRMNEERERKIERFKRLIEDEEVFATLREGLALRPPPSELIDLFLRRRMAVSNGLQLGNDNHESARFFREMGQRFLRPSERASDPNHPVGAMAIAIRKALPHFHDWPLDAGEAAARFLTFTGERRDRLQSVLPPGFAEGHPGAFIRATRALVIPSENGSVRSLYDHLQGSPDEQAFRAALPHARISDALDLTWMVAGLVELRSVQETLERLSAVVLPGIPVRFSAYDESRYRSAWQGHVGDGAARAAYGGVLNDWPGRPSGVDAAHVRILLEPWATARSGQVVDFDRAPSA